MGNSNIDKSKLELIKRLTKSGPIRQELLQDELKAAGLKSYESKRNFRRECGLSWIQVGGQGFWVLPSWIYERAEIAEAKHERIKNRSKIER